MVLVLYCGLRTLDALYVLSPGVSLLGCTITMNISYTKYATTN